MKREKNKVDGWVVLDKPIGPSSTQALGKVRWIFQAAKGGHGGTLDPLASGVLPIALGEATKLIPFAMDGTKQYEFTVRWGAATATDDLEGSVVATSPNRPAESAIRAALPSFEGEIEQLPPAFSAIKIDGKRAYELARAGEEVVLQPRKVLIHKLEYLESPDADTARFRVTCGKGTYVRSLARDLAVALGTVGHVTELRRTRVGKFTLESAISLATLEGFGHSPARFGALAPVETALDDIPVLAVTEEEASALKQGRALRDPRIDRVPAEPIAAFQEGRLVALVASDGEILRPVRVFNL
ncbi:MAG: tRNA pseudouridine(55) synthase TruB [Alphaproteobacteria bacterium]|nr:tRNA pseudouridine(55) synthase TruB [Alphaproteobacteria bacterium]